MIPWEIQNINTSPDNFIWEKDKTSILIIANGIYHIYISIFTELKPNLQILIDGEPILSSINSKNNSQIIHNNKNIGYNKTNQKLFNTNIVGTFLLNNRFITKRIYLYTRKIKVVNLLITEQ